MSIALQYPVDVRGSINSELPYFQLQAFDAGGNPVAGVPITVQAPTSGPSASFYSLVANYELVPTPNPLQVTVTTPTNCQGATVWSVANGIVGSYQFTASTPGAPPLAILATNTPPEAPASLIALGADTRGVAHIGTTFPPIPIVVRGASGLPIADVPVMINLPVSGPGGTFPDGTLSATVYSDVFGRALATVTANSQVGTFYVTASAPGVAPIKVGPFVNAGATQAFVQALDPDDPASALAGAPVPFGETFTVRAWVAFPGLPLPPSGVNAGLPQPNGKVTLRVNGVVVSTAVVDQFYYMHLCTDCAVPTLIFFFRANGFPFGQSQLSATYEADSAYDASSSAPEAINVAPQFVIHTATQGQSSVGATGGATDQWSCTLADTAWQSVDQLGTSAQSAPYSFPYGLLAYTLDNCTYHSPVFLAPPPIYQFLVIELPAPLPPGTVFVNYGPTKNSPTPHWYETPASINGATIRVGLADGGTGDDAFSTGGVIAGLGGPALPSVALPTTAVVEFYAASLDHYFISADAQEIAALDNQVIPGWSRTGLGFNAYANGMTNTQPACRFYIPPQDGDSHFYSASQTECALTHTRFPQFVYESNDVFNIGLPDTSSGACPAGTIPVYRVWNQRADSNHRYTTSRTIRDQMIARGYAAEGYGPDAVIMCAAPQ